MIHTAEQVLKKYPLRDSEISIVLEDFCRRILIFKSLFFPL